MRAIVRLPFEGAGFSAVVAGVVAAGAAVGMAAERAAVGRTFRRDTEKHEPYGQLRGRVVNVRAADGILLHVEVDDPPSGAPDDGLTIIFSHGFALNQDSWHYQRRDLRSLGRLVFWDQRSHGRSQRGGEVGHRVALLGHDLRAVLDATAPTGPVILVGHSMGGMTVMGLAAEYPELFGPRIVGVGLISTSAGGINEVALGLPALVAAGVHRVMPTAAAALSRSKEIIERGRERGSDIGFWVTKLYSFGGPVPPSLTKFVAEMIGSTPIDVIAEFLPSFDKHDMLTAMEAFHHVELLVLVGDSDLLTPEKHSHEIVRLVPGAEFVVLPATGHMSMLERYPEVNAQLRDLLRRVRANLAADHSAEEPPASAITETA